MKIFLDSANVKEIEKWLCYGIVDGVTTNPSIMLKDGIYNIEEGVKKLAKLISPLPLSAEVTTNDLKEMMEQAKWLASLAHNVVIKIPVENEFGAPCLGVISQLEKAGIKVNATAILSFGQLMFAARPAPPMSAFLPAALTMKAATRRKSSLIRRLVRRLGFQERADCWQHPLRRRCHQRGIGRCPHYHRAAAISG